MRAHAYAERQARRWTPLAVTCAAAGGVGLLGGLSPVAGVVAVGTGAGALLLGFGAQLRVLFLAFLVTLLIVYAFLGRGGAYVAVGPLYIGEIGLVLAALTIIAGLHQARLTALHWLLIVFAIWGVARTVPYISRDGIDALRDGVAWAYAAFALAISFTVSKAQFPKLLSLYRRVVPLFLVWVPVAALMTLALGSAVPAIPGSSIPIVVFKSGDMAVHLAGAAAFILMGQYATRGPTIAEALLWPVWFAGVAVSAALSRAALLAIAVAMVATLLLRPSRRWLIFAALAIFMIGSVRLVNPSVALGGDRDVSLSQLTDNFKSVVSDEGQSELEGTEDWRLEWWDEIIGYTVRGPHFWAGKGFGANLADEDGFQIPDGSLRSPHNGHLTVLARMGVPGVVLWIAIQGTFALSLLRAFFVARARGDVFWAQVDGWLFVYWLAMITNMSFDVYLEGPQGGIWFWSVFGLGLAALAAQSLPERRSEQPRETGWHADPRGS